MALVPNVDMAAIARYPKRKRDVVQYAESQLDGLYFSDDEEYLGDDDVPSAKKRKLAAPKPLPKRKIFPFLELPGEIRNVIYELCLTDPNGIYLRSTSKNYRRTVQRVTEKFVVEQNNCRCDRSYDRPNDQQTPTHEENPEVPTLAPGLLSVCKQINSEAREFLYNHHFHVENPQTLHSFLIDIGASNAARLQHLTMRQWTHERGRKAYNHTCFTALRPAVNLVSFNTHGYMCCKEDAQHIGRQLYRDGFHWMEAVGRAHGKKDAAADIVNVRCLGWREINENIVDGYRKELRRLLSAN